MGLLLGQKHVSFMEILSSRHFGSDLIVRIGDIILSPSPKLTSFMAESMPRFLLIFLLLTVYYTYIHLTDCRQLIFFCV